MVRIGPHNFFFATPPFDRSKNGFGPQMNHPYYEYIDWYYIAIRVIRAGRYW